MIDDYSRYLEVEIISNLSARTVLPKLENIFARQGIPLTLKTDNGPPFNGQEFHTFSKQYGFNHRKVTPYWPEANGEVERFMKTLNKFIRTQVVEKFNWKSELATFLRHYRSTPHASTKISPFHALTGRKMNAGLPSATLLSKPISTSSLHTLIFQNDNKSKQIMTKYANKKRKTKPHTLKIGDIVLVKQKKINKFSTPFNPNPYTVVKKKGNMITAKSSENQFITRNSSYFKLISKNKPGDSLLDIPASSSRSTSSKSINYKHFQSLPNKPNSIYFPAFPDMNNNNASEDVTSSPETEDNQTVQTSRPERERRPPTYLQDYVHY